MKKISDMGGALLLSDEDYANCKLHPEDAQLLRDARDPQPDRMIPVTKEKLMELAEMAQKLQSKLRAEIKKKMTAERAKVIYDLRVNQKYSWRLLAAATWGTWGDDAKWQPPSNQLAGIVLCEVAAEQI